MDNLLGLPDPHTYSSRVSFIRAQDRVLGIQIIDQDAKASTSAIEVNFSQVLYFNGPLTWTSADLYLEPPEISNQLVQRINPSTLSDDPKLGVENFHLYSFQNPMIPVQILARTFEILSQ